MLYTGGNEYYDPFAGDDPTPRNSHLRNMSVVWLRPQQLRVLDQWLGGDWVLYRDPHPDDITQGLLGTLLAFKLAPKVETVSHVRLKQFSAISNPRTAVCLEVHNPAGYV